MIVRLAIAITITAVMANSCACYGQNDTPRSSYLSLDLSKRLDDCIESVVTRGIEAGHMPGCVVCVGDSQKVIFHKSFGRKSVEPVDAPMTDDTIFDLASLTKPIATGTAIVKLAERKQIAINDPIAKHWKEFAQNGKEHITIYDCLVHRSGLIPDNALSDYQRGPEVAWTKISELGLQHPLGEKFRYSDVNFLVLGKVIEIVSGTTLDDFVKREILDPCDMIDSGFTPPDSLRERIAPTDKRSGEWVHGVVHDPRAFLLGGVAGHAGLFSTTSDLAKFATMILNRGQAHRPNGDAITVLNPNSVDSLFVPHDIHGDIRSLGWDMSSRYSSNKGKKLSSNSIGHGGFTGTVLWIDRTRNMYFCFLSSRLHPDGHGNVNPIAGTLWDTICQEFDAHPNDAPN